MKLSEWARKNNIQYMTAHRWFKSGILPVPAIQLETGTILIQNEIPVQNTKEVVLYARVSSHDQKEDLDRQLSRLRDYATANGYKIINEFKEIASGMNSKRPKLLSILNEQKYKNIMVEHKDRLTRFGFELISAALQSNSRNILVINDTEEKMDLVQDFIDVITSMCGRIYGKRSASNKVKKIKDVINETSIQ